MSESENNNSASLRDSSCPEPKSSPTFNRKSLARHRWAVASAMVAAAAAAVVAGAAFGRHKLDIAALLLHVLVGQRGLI